MKTRAKILNVKFNRLVTRILRELTPTRTFRYYRLLQRELKLTDEAISILNHEIEIVKQGISDDELRRIEEEYNEQGRQV